MRERSYKKILLICAYIYLMIPCIIFIAGWLRWYISLPILAVIVLSGAMIFRNLNANEKFAIEKSDINKIIIILLLIFIWVLLSGIGGLSYQSQDHEYRTVIYKALVEYRWPVRSADGTRGLIYYIGYWLPSALVGKILGYRIGYWFQAVWAFIGISIVYGLICVRRKKIDIWPLIILIFFSGLDYLGVWILGRDGRDLFNPIHIEWWANDFQYSSMTTQLYWVFNQAIPAWVALATIIVEKNKKHVLFILSMIMFTSTFPFVGMIPIALYILFKNFNIKDKEAWKKVFSFPNIIGAGTICLLFLIFLIGNISATNVGADTAAAAGEYADKSAQLISYILFCILEFGVYYSLIYKYHKKDILFYILFVVLLLCPFVKVGGAHDFCMRASIPALFVLMIWCMDALELSYRNKEWKTYVPLIVCLVIGAITPFNEIHKSVRETITSYEKKESSQAEEVDIEKQLFKGNNFSGSVKGNVFYKYFARGVNLKKQYQHLLEVGIVKSEETLYYEDANLKDGDFATFCDGTIDTETLWNNIQDCESDFLISNENMMRLITEYTEEISQFIAQNYICDKKFTTNLYFKLNKYGKHYSTNNIICLPTSGFSYKSEELWAEKEMQVLIFNPYDKDIMAQLDFSGQAKNSFKDDIKEIYLEYNGNKVATDLFSKYIDAEMNVEIPSGISYLTASLLLTNEVETSKLYRVDAIDIVVDEIYDDIVPTAKCITILQDNDVPVIMDEIVTNVQDKDDLAKIVHILTEEHEEQLLIANEILQKLMENYTDDISAILLENYRVKEQMDKYSLFSWKASSTESVKSALVICNESLFNDNDEMKIYIYNPYEEDISTGLSFTVETPKTLADKKNRLQIKYGETEKMVSLNKASKEVTIDNCVLKSGENVITLKTNMTDYIMKDGKKQYFDIKNFQIDIAQINTAESNN